MTNERLRQIPAVDSLLRDSETIIQLYGRDATTDALRAVLEIARKKLVAGEDFDISPHSLIAYAGSWLGDHFRPSLQPVINASGVIIHTNLGRAPISEEAQAAIQAISSGYSNLEFDLETGKRGSRTVHAGDLLCELTGAEAALVVNNNAAATVLMLAALAVGREVIVSRGQLVEIGGGFRVPDVMAQSGARLVEVGTTNRTRPADYEAAISDNTALLMRVHSSNFRIIGFTEETDIAELAVIAHKHGIHAVDDLGSGALIDTAQYGLDHEPTPQESLKADCDVVCFSGDKLLGGPQAGILLGKKLLIDRIRQHPLARAFRADKFTLAALSATLGHYRRGQATQKIPVLRMIARSLTDIEACAQGWANELGNIAAIIDGESTVGGGSLPGATLPTKLLALKPTHPDDFTKRLRMGKIPVIARIMNDLVVLDPRTVLEHQESDLLACLKNTIAESSMQNFES